MTIKKRWNIFDPLPYKSDIEEIRQQVRVDSIIGSLLFQRGLKNYKEIKDFFCIDLSKLHPPELMSDMDVAGKRLIKAIQSGEKILVYGDYDVDGTTAVALFYSFLKKCNADAGYYLPDRYSEGYGLSFEGIDFAEANGYSLIVTLDCGIKSHDKINYAVSKGIDVIVCDHHLPPDVLPAAYAILNPKKKHCPYPYKDLTGCGIGFKLVQHLNHLLEVNENIYEYLDLVALSIGADIVPITGENRIMTHFGLQKINQNPRPAIKALNYLLSNEDTYDVSKIVFTIGPRINSAGRISHGKLAVEFLASEDEEEALILAQEIDKLNEQRKTLDSKVTQDAIEQAELKGLDGKKTVVVASEDWHKGVIGIVASRIIDRHYRPTIVFCKQNDKWVGSGRSIPGFDLYAALEQCSNYIEQFGGHTFAAGLTVNDKDLNDFIQNFENFAQSILHDDLLIPTIDIAAELPLHQIRHDFIEVLNRFAPFGPENMNPTFCAYNVYDVGWCKVVGINSLKMELYQKENPAKRFQAIAYGLGDFFPIIHRKQPVHIAYKILRKKKKNQDYLLLQIEDIRTDY
ncbi:MAG: single-stranded-DNA-specific exonuclease RecJ [Bacteroidia bacterium]|nr:single-stranded-DNA-specific exonuclease RecJ [Bacteroidia bacterium]